MEVLAHLLEPFYSKAYLRKCSCSNLDRVDWVVLIRMLLHGTVVGLTLVGKQIGSCRHKEPYCTQPYVAYHSV